MTGHPGVAARFANPCGVCGATDEHESVLAGVAEAIRSGVAVATYCPHPERPGHGTGCVCAGRSQAEPDWPKAVADALAAALMRDAGALRHAIGPLDDHELRRIHEAAMMLARETGKRRWDRRGTS